MAFLQNEVGTNEFFSRHEFPHAKCSEIFPDLFVAFILCVQKHPAKLPPNFPQYFPAVNQGEFTDELLEARRERRIVLATPLSNSLRTLSVKHAITFTPLMICSLNVLADFHHGSMVAPPESNFHFALEFPRLWLRLQSPYTGVSTPPKSLRTLRA